MLHSGCEISSVLDTSHPVMLTKEALSMSNQMICEDTHSATSSPESVDGATLLDSLDGPITDLLGQALAPASRSVPQASSVAAMMHATYGLRSSASSESVALAASLASRLPVLLDSRGSTMFALTWKAQVTPQRRQICQLAARAHPTKDSGCSGWLTPRARGDAGGKRWRAKLAKNLEDQARIYALMRGLTDTEVARLSLSASFVRRLMGYPAEWDDCAPLVTPSCLKSRRSSSKQ